MEKAYKLKFAASEKGSLHNTSCGISKTESFHSFGPAVKPFFLIHFILSGKGRFRYGEKEYHLEANNGFVISPDTPAFYQADGDDPWTYVWVGFTGTAAEHYVEQLGLSESHPVFYSEKAQELYSIVKDMMEYNTYSMSDTLRRNGDLSLFLSVIGSSTQGSVEEKEDKANTHVEKAIEYVRLNYCNPIKVTDIADYVCINRSYLYSLFEQTLHISPQEFLTRYRITKSLELLHATDYPVESIALSSGYSDAMVFSKAFKAMMGVSPSVYRTKMRTEGAGSKEALIELEALITKAVGN